MRNITAIVTGATSNENLVAELESYVICVRAEAIGWMHTDDCIDLDAGRDPRKKEVPDMLARAQAELS